ncbi:MAG: hypothetical protein ACKOW3_08470 [Hyphomicrobium sp.]
MDKTLFKLIKYLIRRSLLKIITYKIVARDFLLFFVLYLFCTSFLLISKKAEKHTEELFWNKIFTIEVSRPFAADTHNTNIFSELVRHYTHKQPPSHLKKSTNRSDKNPT